MASQKFQAEVLFLDPANVARATEVLTWFDCNFEIDRDAVDPCGPTVFGWVTGTTELEENDIGDWLLAIVDPLGGDVVEWGFGRRPQATPAT
jgi:hypothetical protein